MNYMITAAFMLLIMYRFSTSSSSGGQNDVLPHLAFMPENMTLSCMKVDPSYKAALQKTANSDKVLLLALADTEYIDMTLNFYETSLEPLKIQNVLFIAPTISTCDILEKYNLQCYVFKTSMQYYEHEPDESHYGSSVFNKKMILRTRAIIDALMCGYTLLHTDVDMHFFKNPLPYFTCTDCDIEALEDGWPDNLNAGFVYLRPTRGTITIYNMLLDTITKSIKEDDQVSFNKAWMTVGASGKFKIRSLDIKTFLCGRRYYEENKRYFSKDITPCKDCIVVHNNWILGKAAKLYRAKETGMWMYDGNKYYSDTTRKYIVYSNPLSISDDEQTLLDLEYSSLVSALAIGRILNRTVILPRFHCSTESEQCSLNSVYRISTFDHHFRSAYREHSFLDHPKVPSHIKDYQSPFIVIHTKKAYGELCLKTTENDMLFTPANPHMGATSDEIKQWLDPYSTYSVLRFHSLYGAFFNFNSEIKSAVFKRDITEGLTRAGYRQYIEEFRVPIKSLWYHFWGNVWSLFKSFSMQHNCE